MLWNFEGSNTAQSLIKSHYAVKRKVESLCMERKGKIIDFNKYFSKSVPMSALERALEFYDKLDRSDERSEAVGKAYMHEHFKEILREVVSQPWCKEIIESARKDKIQRLKKALRKFNRHNYFRHNVVRLGREEN